MTVDSEAIFALVDAYGTSPETLAELVGAMAAAWLDERDPGVLHLARGVGRPLWIGRGRHEVLFASTRAALEVAEHALHTTFLKSQRSAAGARTRASGRSARSPPCVLRRKAASVSSCFRRSSRLPDPTPLVGVDAAERPEDRVRPVSRRHRLGGPARGIESPCQIEVETRRTEGPAEAPLTLRGGA